MWICLSFILIDAVQSIVHYLDVI